MTETVTPHHRREMILSQLTRYGGPDQRLLPALEELVEVEDCLAQLIHPAITLSHVSLAIQRLSELAQELSKEILQ